jgi:hypothetical protein
MQAAEGFWEENSPSPAPYNWIIVPDQARQRNRFTLSTPVLGSIWTLRKAALKSGFIGAEEFDRIVDPEKMVGNPHGDLKMVP